MMTNVTARTPMPICASRVAKRSSEAVSSAVRQFSLNFFEIARYPWYSPTIAKPAPASPTARMPASELITSASNCFFWDEPELDDENQPLCETANHASAVYISPLIMKPMRCIQPLASEPLSSVSAKACTNLQMI